LGLGVGLGLGDRVRRWDWAKWGRTEICCATWWETGTLH